MPSRKAGVHGPPTPRRHAERAIAASRSDERRRVSIEEHGGVLRSASVVARNGNAHALTATEFGAAAADIANTLADHQSAITGVPLEPHQIGISSLMDRGIVMSATA